MFIRGQLNLSVSLFKKPLSGFFQYRSTNALSLVLWPYKQTTYQCMGYVNAQAVTHIAVIKPADPSAILSNISQNYFSLQILDLMGMDKVFGDGKSYVVHLFYMFSR
ncbi:hypothetical protein IBT54_004920 [Pantoea sp. S62]|nr:hypothetical protein [Pantoea sp. S62]